MSTRRTLGGRCCVGMRGLAGGVWGLWRSIRCISRRRRRVGGIGVAVGGGGFGAGHYAMCGKAYDPGFLFAWATARYAVMSGASAAGALVEVRVKQLERGGKTISEEERKRIFDEIKATYDAQADPRYGAARGWIDAIIDPVETRSVLMTALEACALNAEGARFNPGVFQT